MRTGNGSTTVTSGAPNLDEARAVVARGRAIRQAERLRNFQAADLRTRKSFASVCGVPEARGGRPVGIPLEGTVEASSGDSWRSCTIGSATGGSTTHWCIRRALIWLHLLVRKLITRSRYFSFSFPMAGRPLYSRGDHFSRFDLNCEPSNRTSFTTVSGISFRSRRLQELLRVLLTRYIQVELREARDFPAHDKHGTDKGE